jgi:hypothetical protein
MLARERNAEGRERRVSVGRTSENERSREGAEGGGEVNYDEIDEGVRTLVRVLNELEGIETIGSCGGHVDGVPGGMRAPANEWWVTFSLEPADTTAAVAAPSPRAWLDLEFLAYWLQSDRAFELVPWAPPPHLNEPGRMLRFELRGFRDSEGGIEPDEVAAHIRQGLDELYLVGGELP